MSAPFDTPRVFNVGNPANAITVHDLAARIRELLSSSSEIVFTDTTTIYGSDYVPSV